MTDKELKKLTRGELLEIMLNLRLELDEVREENQTLRAKLEENERSVFALKNDTRLILEGVAKLCGKQGIAFEIPEKDVKGNDLTEASQLG